MAADIAGSFVLKGFLDQGYDLHCPRLISADDVAHFPTSRAASSATLCNMEFLPLTSAGDVEAAKSLLSVTVKH